VEAQDEVFAQDDVRMTATLNPGGTAVRTNGGCRVTGVWRFDSGSSHAHWCAQPALMQNDINTSSLPTPIGPAKSTLERLPGSSITYTFYSTKAEAPITHMQVAEAALKTQAAKLMAYPVADAIDQHAVDRVQFSLEDQARIQGTTGFVTRLCHEAVEVMRFGSEASSIRLDVPIQRVTRDMPALNVHAMAGPTSTPGVVRPGAVRPGAELLLDLTRCGRRQRAGRTPPPVLAGACSTDTTTAPCARSRRAGSVPPPPNRGARDT
jgi:hypothetical protein